jgi:hypothetical protein
MPSRFLRIWLRSRTEPQVLINAVIGQVKSAQISMSGYPTYRELRTPLVNLL